MQVMPQPDSLSLINTLLFNQVLVNVIIMIITNTTMISITITIKGIIMTMISPQQLPTSHAYSSCAQVIPIPSHDNYNQVGPRVWNYGHFIDTTVVHMYHMIYQL